MESASTEQSWVDFERDPTLSAPADIVSKTIPFSTPQLALLLIIDERDDDYSNLSNWLLQSTPKFLPNIGDIIHHKFDD